MAVATLTRGTNSIDLPLELEGGEIVAAVTFGAPETNIRESGGTLNPRVSDEWSKLQNIQLEGTVFSYDKAHDLADMVKSASLTPLELTLPGDVYDDNMLVAPSAGSDSALQYEIPAGRKDVVNVQLTLTRVGELQGSLEQTATTPRATGTGPVQIRVGSTTVDLPTADLSVERAVGRPNDAVRRKPQVADPRYVVKPKVAADTFAFSWATLEDIPATLNAITDNIFREQLGRSGVTVDFNGVLGLGEIEAIPVGSSPFRQVHQAGRSWVNVPQLELRRILSQG
ncbi:hypothetical protein M196_gp69 [Halorubrum tailed virus 4]|uniref:Uncharacterized protein n=1 Tax=Halorubrum tailed virus 4 TaxID=1273752 RepID=R4TG10_9CAUD|nr:hypothetical protein M196_gp69 [Halorubrum tailed virus 4]AGM11161.1 hypothetical protein HRTV4_69 [Halorubrum tailed virus 4]